MDHPHFGKMFSPEVGSFLTGKYMCTPLSSSGFAFLLVAVFSFTCLSPVTQPGSSTGEAGKS